MKAVIVYWTKTGHTGRAAEDIAEALQAAGHEVTQVNLRTEADADLTGAEVVAVGSPCHGGSFKGAGTGIARPVEGFLRSLPRESLAGKRVGAFSVHSGAGGLRTVNSIEGFLADAGGEVVSPGPVVKAGVPLSLWVGPRASEADREQLRDFARALAAKSS
jgi:flavodoxin